MLKIAITGGIASGKSTVSAIIENMGYKVFSADTIYSELTERSEVVINICRITDTEPIINGDKVCINRGKIAEKVFKQRELLNKLNNYTHNLVYQKIEDIIENDNDSAMLFFEIPLLFESKRQDMFDKIIVVLRDKEQRVSSLKERSNLTKEQAIERMNSQIDYDNFDLSKHTLIYNNADFEALRNQVESVIESYKKIIADF